MFLNFTEDTIMIERYDVNEEWAHCGIIKAGDFCFLNYCVGNVGGSIEQQVNGAFDEMEKRLALVGLTLENVVQMDCLFRYMGYSRHGKGDKGAFRRQISCP